MGSEVGVSLVLYAARKICWIWNSATSIDNTIEGPSLINPLRKPTSPISVYIGFSFTVLLDLSLRFGVRIPTIYFPIRIDAEWVLNIRISCARESFTNSISETPRGRAVRVMTRGDTCRKTHPGQERRNSSNCVSQAVGDRLNYFSSCAAFGCRSLIRDRNKSADDLLAVPLVTPIMNRHHKVCRHRDPLARSRFAYFSLLSTAVQSILEKNASMYFGRSAGL